MKTCCQYDKDGIGLTYARLAHGGLLGVSDETDSGLGGKLLDFEKHYFECDECLERLEQDRRLLGGFYRLGREGAAAQFLGRSYEETSTHRAVAALRWLPVAASFVAVAIVSLLALQPGGLRPGMRAGQVGEASTLGQVVELRPAGPRERAASAGVPEVGASAQSALLTVQMPPEIAEVPRLSVRILDRSGHECWKDEHASLGPSGLLLVFLKGGFLAPGPYVLEVRVPDPHKAGERSAEFPFTVQTGASNPAAGPHASSNRTP